MLPDVIAFTAFTMLSGSNPASMLKPASMNSGLSVVSLTITHGTSKYSDSSGIVPESVIKQNAFFSNFVKSKNPSGLIISTVLGIFTFFILLNVLGCIG